MTTAAEMADEIYDSTAAGTAKENIPTMSNPMDNIHGNVEDIPNKASGHKLKKAFSSFSSPSTDAKERARRRELIISVGHHVQPQHQGQHEEECKGNV